MKKISIIISLFIFSSAAFADNVKLDFILVADGGPGQAEMTTSIDGIQGNILWTATSPTYNHPYYQLKHLIDDSIATQVHEYYWLPYLNNTDLLIDFPEPVYITKIRTYNYVGYYSGQGHRFSESAIWTSQDDTMFEHQGDVLLDGTPAWNDYVDIVINDYISSVEYRYISSGYYYAINQIEFYTSDAPPASIPEPATCVLTLISVLSISMRKLFH